VISPLPGWPLVVASPAMFGLAPGLIYSNLGVALGAAVAFALARRYGRRVVLRFFSEQKLAALEQRLSQQQQLLALLLLRLMPMSPFDLINYAAGLSSIPFRYFITITLIGALPANFVLAYTGQIGLSANSYALLVLGLVILLVIFIRGKMKGRGKG